jgi:signal transduction histidine kinase
MVSQIVRNLIDNALKFTEKGRVEISARRSSDEHKLEIKVADSGIGIAEGQIPRIFDKFHQGDSSQTRIYGGVGLGLYIVKRLTERLGGVVEVESRIGKGSTFTVKLPYQD